MSKKLTKEEFIKKSKEVHGDKYDYSKVEYKNIMSKVKIICSTHGIFEQSLNNHINQKNGCPKCAGVSLSNKEEFIEKSIKIFGNKNDYSEVEYEGNKVKVKIKCIKHDISFNQKPNVHLSGREGCPKCIGKVTNVSDFIIKGNKVHKNFYNYEQVKYEYITDLLKIICPIHGLFEQRGSNHLHGQGCPKCGQNNLSEYKLVSFIKNSLPNINLIEQAKPDWLKGKTNRQSLDIFLSDFNIAIEYQGVQHFKPINFFGGQKAFEYLQRLDERKRELCKENNIILFYFTYKINDIPTDYPDKVYSKESDLINKIKELI